MNQRELANHVVLQTVKSALLLPPAKIVTHHSPWLQTVKAVPAPTTPMLSPMESVSAPKERQNFRDLASPVMLSSARLAHKLEYALIASRPLFWSTILATALNLTSLRTMSVDVPLAPLNSMANASSVISPIVLNARHPTCATLALNHSCSSMKLANALKVTPCSKTTAMYVTKLNTAQCVQPITSAPPAKIPSQ